MSWIKSSLIFFLISLITIKAIDITFGYFNNKGSERLFEGERVIHLKEYYPEQRAAITPTDIYMLGTDSLEQKELVLNSQEVLRNVYKDEGKKYFVNKILEIIA